MTPAHRSATWNTSGTDTTARRATIWLLLAAFLVALGIAPAGAAPVPSGPDALSIQRLYRAALLRDPDPSGLAHWSELRAKGTTLETIADQFANSVEYLERTGGLEDQAFVAQTYAEVLGRDPDDGGAAFWTASLAAGASRGAILLGFSDSAEHKVRTGLVGEPYVPPPQFLPDGSRTLFPDHQLVAEYGHPGIPAMGVLAEKDPLEAARQVQLRALDYELRSGRPALPTFEVIATVAQSQPGRDGLYSYVLPPPRIEPWLDAVRTVDGYLILDLQPGRARFIDQARVYESLLLQPDVGLAIDPEWSMGATGVPGRGIGSVTAAEINEVSAYLASLVERAGLPEKALIVHRFTAAMVTDPENVVDRDGIAMVFHADGFGTRHLKLEDYFGLLPDRFARGLKLFIDEDVRIFQPSEVVGLEPPPDVITYQ